jgi:UDP-N-acetylmuramate dehydrogenase
MSIDTEILQNKFGKNIIFKENLSKYSWFNLGGPAEIFFRPKTENQLEEFLHEIKDNNYKINILGAGSNTLIRDAGVKGVVIKLSSNFSNIKLLNQDTIEVGAAALDRKVSDFAKNNDISGMEFLSCIPGSIGGAIIMNSGCYKSDISKILSSIQILDHQGKKREIKNNEK